MKKRLLLAACLCLSALTAGAKCVIITLKSGTLMYYQLGGEKNPVMTFPEGKVAMNDDTFEISDIKNFYISPDDVPEEVALQRVEAPQMRFVGGIFTAKADKGDDVRVYSLGGTEMRVEKSEANGNISININKLQKGTYIIKVGKDSFKVNKK